VKNYKNPLISCCTYLSWARHVNVQFSRLTKTITFYFGLIVLAGLPACGGSTSEANLAIALSVLKAAPSISCPNGGITIQTGIDANNDQLLNDEEVSREQFICNGAAAVNGSSSLSSLLVIQDEPIGTRCSSGGSQVNAGLDVNANSILDATEITSTTYVCHGNSPAAAINGTNGSAGANGSNGAAGDPGSSGATGSTGVSGLPGSNGTNGTNGAIGTSGANGSAGATGSMGATGAAGAAGAAGANGMNGLAGSTGVTGATGANGLLGLLLQFFPF
jgi:hypothetical protein